MTPHTGNNVNQGEAPWQLGAETGKNCTDMYAQLH